MTTTKPEVTVAVPYAGGSLDYFREALHSVRAQTFTDWTAVVVDDSARETEISRTIGDWGDSSLSYKRNEGDHGIGNAWNACIDAVQSEFFCLLHQDDALEPDYLRTMIGLAKAHPEASVYFCGANIIDSAGAPSFSLADRVKEIIEPSSEPIVLRGPSAVASLMIGNYIMCPPLFYRRSRIGQRRFSTQHKFVLDFRFTLALLFSGETIVGTHRKAYRYRRHSSQSTHGLSKDGPRFAEELELFREVAHRSASLGWSNAAMAARIRPTFRLNALLSGRFGYAVL